MYRCLILALSLVCFPAQAHSGDHADPFGRHAEPHQHDPGWARVSLYVERARFGDPDSARERLGGIGLQGEWIGPQIGLRLGVSELSFDDAEHLNLEEGSLGVFWHTGDEAFRAELGVLGKRQAIEFDDRFGSEVLDEDFGLGLFTGGELFLGTLSLYGQTGFTAFESYDELSVEAGLRLDGGFFGGFAGWRHAYLDDADNRQELSGFRFGVQFAF